MEINHLKNRMPHKSLDLQGILAETVGFEPTQLFRVDGLAIRIGFNKIWRFSLILCDTHKLTSRKSRILTSVLNGTKWAQSALFTDTRIFNPTLTEQNQHSVDTIHALFTPFVVNEIGRASCRERV